MVKTILLISFAIAMGLGLGACGSEQAIPGDELMVQGMIPQRVQTPLSKNSSMLDLTGSLTGIPLESTAAHPCVDCEGSHPFKGDGVSIHSCPSTTCTVLGLGYRSQRQSTICGDSHFINNGFGRIENRNTGVRGWSLLHYATAVCD